MGPGPRDPDLLDALDALPREPLSGNVWRVVREARDPLQGVPSHSRWCDGGFDVLYTSLERDGAIAEIHAFLCAQPIFPSRPVWRCHGLRVATRRTLRLADLAALARLGVDLSTWKDRRYGRTQEIADAAHFLDFDGLIAPSARWDCRNLMLFTGRLAPDDIVAANSDGEVIDWGEWRKEMR
jgi:hypothetical protein